MNKIISWLRKTFIRHQWDYRNPYNRTCKTCGRLEIAYYQSLETWNHSWWDAHVDGDKSKHLE